MKLRVNNSPRENFLEDLLFGALDSLPAADREPPPPAPIVPSRGIEPLFQASEACVLSVELRGANTTLIKPFSIIVSDIVLKRRGIYSVKFTLT